MFGLKISEESLEVTILSSFFDFYISFLFFDNSFTESLIQTEPFSGSRKMLECTDKLVSSSSAFGLSSIFVKIQGYDIG